MTQEQVVVPPLRRGARGDRALIVRQQIRSTFNVNLTRRRAQCRVLNSPVVVTSDRAMMILG
ncbi:MAG: hypothetical protein ICV61_02595 [Microcoleus sp. Co-bin12]|nr:hypothetical protein [Microcoleus sp. Co-bin12]